MAIAGIEGLAQGFMQGMALKRQNDRQDVLDAQNLEKFSMDKERFATQQAASAFELQNAQTNAANAATDRARTLGIQKKGDDFEANLGRILGAGTPEGELMALEPIHQANGVKGAWARDPKTGGLAKSADGKFRWVNEDGTAYDASAEDAVGAYIAKVDPKGEYARRVKIKDEIDKEQRQYNNQVKLSGVQTDNAIRLKKETERYTPRSLTFKESPTGTYGIDPVTGKTISVLTPDGLPIISSTTEKEMSPVALSMFDKKETVTEKYGGGTKQITTRDEQGLQDFMVWADENNKPLTVRSVGQWKNANKENKSVTTETTSPQSNQQKLTVNQWIKNRNITTKEQLSSAIAELRKSNPTWSNQQLKQAFVNAGVIE